MRIVVLQNGDLRIRSAARGLAAYGYTATPWDGCGTPPAGDALLLPIPSRSLREPLPMEYPLVIGGGIPRWASLSWQSAGTKVYDLLCDPAFVEENARLTAEAALSLGMEATGRSFLGRKVGVLGFGRIGSCLTRYLLSLGAEVTVLARREGARLTAEELGASALPFEGLTHLPPLDLVYNTIPAPLLTEEMLSLWEEGVLVELASGEGNLPCSKYAKIRLIDGKNLPGRYLPVSAGLLISHATHKYLTTKD